MSRTIRIFLPDDMIGQDMTLCLQEKKKKKDEEPAIRLRDPRWAEESEIRRLLKGIQKLAQLRELLHSGDLYVIEDFVMSLFPIEETAVENGEVTQEYVDFQKGIKDYSIDEFYEKVMKGR